MRDFFRFFFFFFFLPLTLCNDAVVLMYVESVYTDIASSAWLGNWSYFSSSPDLMVLNGLMMESLLNRDDDDDSLPSSEGNGSFG